MKSEKQPSWWGSIACVLAVAAWIVALSLFGMIRNHQATYDPDDPSRRSNVERMTLLTRVGAGATALFSFAGFTLATADLFRPNRRRLWTYLAFVGCGIPAFACGGMFAMMIFD